MWQPDSLVIGASCQVGRARARARERQRARQAVVSIHDAHIIFCINLGPCLNQQLTYFWTIFGSSIVERGSMSLQMRHLEKWGNKGCGE